ncbi:oxidoreductase [Acrasis kona]|uniref:Oxidoreductase n=1 Tax=Acrasis kona TaxID=1008807 RepID=A0AAW2YUB1_9EUKA
MSALDFKVAVITGAAGGLGKAFATSLIKFGKKVIIVGRTESSLASTAKEIGALGYYVLDVSKFDTIPTVVNKILKDHPDVDCLINNAGVQKQLDFTDPNITSKLGDVDEEVAINITGLVHLVAAFTPHFIKSDVPSAVMNVSSGLAYVPISPVPVYCATKAFVKSFTLSLRHQLRNTKVKVYEIAPPLVESDLHRDHDNADAYTKEKMPHCLTVAEFMSGIEEGWNKGDLDIGVGMAKQRLQAWDSVFKQVYGAMNPK